MLWMSSPGLPDSEEGVLCCCEYYNRRGVRAHCLACCCECDLLDQVVDTLVSGRRPGNDKIDEVIADLDDRLRLPTPYGAWHIGLPRAVPWSLLPPLLLLGSLSARALLLSAGVLLSSVFWWHRRALRLRRRSQFLLSWQIASMAWEAFVVVAVLPGPAGAGTCAFGAAALASLCLLARCKLCDVSSTAGVADAAAASARGVICAVSGAWVPRYDHYCAWIDESVGAANHRPFLAFLLAMVSACGLGMRELFFRHPGSSWGAMLLENRSSLFLACFAYAGAVGALVGALLAHQLWLLWRGRTTYEDRRRRREAPSGEADPLGLTLFFRQTAPVLRVARANSSRLSLVTEPRD